FRSGFEPSPVWISAHRCSCVGCNGLGGRSGRFRGKAITAASGSVGPEGIRSWVLPILNSRYDLLTYPFCLDASILSEISLFPYPLSLDATIISEIAVFPKPSHRDMSRRQSLLCAS